ncbi:hypothetical protein [Ferruginibacter sp.]|nr:hypothetical protein [Ferruginibacter sp.]
MKVLQSIVHPPARGHPVKWFLRSSKSLRNIETALREMGNALSYLIVSDLLKLWGCSLQANKKNQKAGKAPLTGINSLSLSIKLLWFL